MSLELVLFVGLPLLVEASWIAVVGMEPGSESWNWDERCFASAFVMDACGCNLRSRLAQFGQARV